MLSQQLKKTAAELTAADIMAQADAEDAAGSREKLADSSQRALVNAVPAKNEKEEQSPPETKEIILNDENYTKILSDIEANPSQYIDKKITAEGFVYRDPTFGENDFVVARMFMVCCAADAQIAGLMARWDDSSALEDKQWIQVKGILKTQTYTLSGEESLIPIIHIQSVIKKKDNVLTAKGLKTSG